ncbi:cell division protein FtsQ/DivIB [Brockia lithotrophica]|uniref:Cell division septal protein FtsQ n=1 Tax=Brockia lithotrophica TaxID=933949 RepID=A0A660L6P1_9BACL|nr:hypothetical protein [Brockia lithotrophica]RKQ88489.1 cell division septal protein FtsQ [Brockia lithotrophica]
MRRKLRFFVALFFFGVAVAAYAFSPYAKVGSVVVDGAVRVPRQEVLALSGVREGDFLGRALWARRNLLASGEFRSARVRWTFPNRIFLSVEEEEAVGLLAEGGTLLANGHVSPFVLPGSEGSLRGDRDASPVDEPPKGASPSLPRLVDVPHDLFPRLAAELAATPKEVRTAIAEVRGTPRASDPEALHLRFRDGLVAETTLRHLGRMLASFPAVRRALPDAPKGVLYLYPEGIYYSERPKSF